MIEALDVPSLKTVQSCCVDTQLRGLQASPQGVDWALLTAPGEAAAAPGSQRGGPGSKFSLLPLLPPGLSKEKDIASSAKLNFPFSGPAPLDDDLCFAACAPATMGPSLKIRRQKQVRAPDRLASRLLLWECQARQAMHPAVAKVAGSKSPIFLALQAIVLR